MSSVDFSGQCFISDCHQRLLAKVKVRPLTCQTWTIDGTSYRIENSLSIKCRLYCLVFLSFLFDCIKSFLKDYLEDLKEEYKLKEDIIEGLKTFKDRGHDGLDILIDELINNMFTLLSLKELQRGLHGASLLTQKGRIDERDVPQLGGESGQPAPTGDALRSLDSDPQHVSTFSARRQTSSLCSRLWGKDKQELLCARAKELIAGIAACEPFMVQAWIGVAQEVSFPEISAEEVKETLPLQDHIFPLSVVDERGGGPSKLFDVLLERREKPTNIPIAHLCRPPMGEIELRPIQCSTWTLDERSYHITKSLRTDLSLYLLKLSAYFSSSFRPSLEKKLQDLDQEHEKRMKNLKQLCGEIGHFVNQGVQVERIRTSCEREVQAILSLKNQEETLRSLAWFMKHRAGQLYGAVCLSDLTEGQTTVLKQVYDNPRSKLKDVEIDNLLSLLEMRGGIEVFENGSKMERSLLSSYLKDSSPTLAAVRGKMAEHVGEAQRLVEKLAAIHLVPTSSWLSVVRNSHHPELSYRVPQRSWALEKGGNSFMDTMRFSSLRSV